MRIPTLVLVLFVVCASGCRTGERQPFVATSISGTPAEATLQEAFAELDVALDYLFEVVDNRDVEILVNATGELAVLDVMTRHFKESYLRP